MTTRCWNSSSCRRATSRSIVVLPLPGGPRTSSDFLGTRSKHHGGSKCENNMETPEKCRSIKHQINKLDGKVRKCAKTKPKMDFLFPPPSPAPPKLAHLEGLSPRTSMEHKISDYNLIESENMGDLGLQIGKISGVGSRSGTSPASCSARTPLNALTSSNMPYCACAMRMVMPTLRDSWMAMTHPDPGPTTHASYYPWNESAIAQNYHPKKKSNNPDQM